eukprot:m.1075403 g.1075403  ORF g.1075403 m.1075403 type:complete len:424 (+) comp24240_c0_seq5:338-1609(+)
MVRVGPVPVNLNSTNNDDRQRGNVDVSRWAQPRSGNNSASTAETELRHSLRMREISKKWKAGNSSHRSSHSPGGATATRITERTSPTLLEPQRRRETPSSRSIEQGDNATTGLDRNTLPPLSASNQDSACHSQIAGNAHPQGDTANLRTLPQGAAVNESSLEQQSTIPANNDDDFLPASDLPTDQSCEGPTAVEQCEAKSYSEIGLDGNVDFTRFHRRVLYIQSFLSVLCLVFLVVVLLAASSNESVVSAVNIAEATYSETATVNFTKISLGLIYFVLEDYKGVGIAGNAVDSGSFTSDLCYSGATPFFATDTQCDDCERAGKAACGVLLLAIIVNILRTDISVNRHSKQLEKHATSYSAGAIGSSTVLIVLDAVALGILWSSCMKRLRDDPTISATFGNAYIIAGVILLIDGFQLILHFIFI